MHVAFAEPCGPLRPYIGGYYLVTLTEPHLRDVLRADIGRLRFFLEGRGGIIGERETQAGGWPVTLSGPSCRAQTFRLFGPAQLFGIVLLPRAWGSIIPTAAAALRNMSCDALPLFTPKMAPLLEELRRCAAIDQMARTADAFFTPRASASSARASEVSEHMRRWLRSDFAPDTSALFAQLALSARQIERISNQHWGFPPRALARKYAALRTAYGLAAEGKPPAASITHYADAAHLIREVRRVTGQTPRQICAAGNKLLRTSLILPSFPELQDRG